MITELVPCGNPKIKELSAHEKRSVAISGNFIASKRNGVTYCAWCWVRPLPKGRRSYCSDECRESCQLFCYPQTTAGLTFLLLTREFECEECGHGWRSYVEGARQDRIKWLEEFRSKFPNDWKWINEQIADLKGGKVTDWLINRSKNCIPDEFRPEIDHIIPVALGGTTLGFENLQVLCRTCHASKTKADMIAIRRAKEQERKCYLLKK